MPCRVTARRLFAVLDLADAFRAVQSLPYACHAVSSLLVACHVTSCRAARLPAVGHVCGLPSLPARFRLVPAGSDRFRLVPRRPPAIVSACMRRIRPSENRQQRPYCAGEEVTVSAPPGPVPLTIVRSYGPIFGVNMSIQSHVTNLRVRRIVTTAVERYELM